MVTFEEAVRLVQSDWPNYEVASYGYEGDTDWFILLLPPTMGGRVAAVAKAEGTVRWINENADEYMQERPVGNWQGADGPGGG